MANSYQQRVLRRQLSAADYLGSRGADGIDAQFELATGLDGSLASAAAVRLEALAKLSATRCVEINFKAP